MLGTVLGGRKAVDNKVYMFPNPNGTYIPVEGGGVEQMQIKQNKLLKYKFSKYNIRNK